MEFFKHHLTAFAIIKFINQADKPPSLIFPFFIKNRDISYQNRLKKARELNIVILTPGSVTELEKLKPGDTITTSARLYIPPFNR